MWTLAHRRLQEAAIYLWPNARDCRVLVTESGMDASNLDFDEPPALRWQSVISEAEKQNAMQKLVPVMLARYPDNSQLKSACAPFAAAEPVSAPETARATSPPQDKSAVPVPPGAVLVPEFGHAASASTEQVAPDAAFAAVPAAVPTAVPVAAPTAAALAAIPVPPGAVLVPKFANADASTPFVIEETESAATIASLRLVATENERRLGKVEQRLAVLESWREYVETIALPGSAPKVDDE